MLLKQLIQKKLNHQESNRIPSYIYIGTILMLLSGAIVFTDNIIFFFYPEVDKISIGYFGYLSSFIFSISTSLSLILMGIAILMNAYRYSILSPILAGLIMVIAAISNASGFRISGIMQFYLYIPFLIFIIIRYFNKFKKHIENIRIIERAKNEYIRVDNPDF